MGASREIPTIIDGDSAKPVISGKSNPTHDFHSPVQPTNMRDERNSRLFSRTIESNRPGLWQYHSLQSQQEPRTSPPKTSMVADISYTKSPINRYGTTNSEEKDMTLVDIDDFEMRKKIAQLMAVAPALPVKDLYHLIIDSEGRLSKAKKKAIRMSKAPDTLRTPTQLSLQPRALINNSDTEGVIVNIRDSDKQKTMVKIDPSDPFFKWDDDEPAPEQPPTVKPCQSKSTAKKKQPQSARSHHSANEPKPKPPATLTPSYQSKKRTKAPHSKRTNIRETSSDREFIVANDGMQYVSDFDDSDDFILSRNVIIPSRTRRRRRKFSMI